MSPTQRTRVGLRREVAILLPVTLLLLVLLASFTLFSYRSAIHLLRDERRLTALATAGQIGEIFSGTDQPTLDRLAAVSPDVVRIALIDGRGRTVFERGPRTGEDLLDTFAGEDLASPVATGPSRAEGWVSALVPLRSDRGNRYLRIDLESGTLARQIAGLRILTWVVLSINGALTILVLLFLRHILRPYDRLLASARQLLPEASQVEDEVAFLVSSFERAVALGRGKPSSADELEALERTLGPSLESGFLLIGLDDEVLALNSAGAEILGVSLPDLPVSLDELLANRGTSFASVIREATASGEVIQRRETGLTRHDETLTLGLSVNPLRRDDGSTRAFLVLFADLTETRRQAQEERVASSLAQVGELAAGVAHEMRNSLATFRGYLTLVARSPEDESIRDYLVELRRESDRMQRVLEDFLSFARPESTQFESLDIDRLLRQAAADPVLHDHSFEIYSTSVPIKGDEQLLERALRNLLHNAVDASLEAASEEPVEVRVSTGEEEIYITISDRGAGIPRDIRDTVFQPFVTGKSDGVGMGLALALRIFQLHGGRLTLADRDGGGTVATATLPGGGEAVRR